MKSLSLALLGGFFGFITLAFLGYFAILLLSPDSRDLEVNATILAVIVAGPLGAIVGAIVGYRLSGKS